MKNTLKGLKASMESRQREAVEALCRKAQETFADAPLAKRGPLILSVEDARGVVEHAMMVLRSPKAIEILALPVVRRDASRYEAARAIADAIHLPHIASFTRKPVRPAGSHRRGGKWVPRGDKTAKAFNTRSCVRVGRASK